jgi:hypothetical protein
LPKLIDLYEEYKDVREHFEIVAFHDASVKTLEEVDAKLKERNIVEERWKGRQLPFPVLIDETRSTIDGWGIRAFPTLVLLDPEGKVVKGNAEQLLRKQLDELRGNRPGSDGTPE